MQGVHCGMVGRSFEVPSMSASVLCRFLLPTPTSSQQGRLGCEGKDYARSKTWKEEPAKPSMIFDPFNESYFIRKNPNFILFGYQDFGEFMRENRLTPFLEPRRSLEIPLERAKDQLEKHTRYWPMIISQTTIFNMQAVSDLEFIIFSILFWSKFPKCIWEVQMGKGGQMGN